MKSCRRTGWGAGNGLDADSHGYVDDVNGWDLVNGDNAPADEDGHGTRVASVAAAASNNGIGIAGVCWGCRLMPVVHSVSRTHWGA